MPSLGTIRPRVHRPGTVDVPVSELGGGRPPQAAAARPPPRRGGRRLPNQLLSAAQLSTVASYVGERHTRHKDKLASSRYTGEERRTHTAQRARVRRARDARLEAGRVRPVEWVSEHSAHSVGSVAAPALVAPLVRVLSSAISSTICAASENTAAVTVPARWSGEVVRRTDGSGCRWCRRCRRARASCMRHGGRGSASTGRRGGLCSSK